MSVLAISITTVALAEIGDKTQLLSLLLASRYRKPIPIIAAIFLATLANHALAAWLGVVVADYLSPDILKWVLVVSFLAMAGWILIPDKLDGEESISTRGPFVASFIAFFMAEIGDKTQIATSILGAQYADALSWVIVGTTLGMLLANVPVVLIGKLSADKMPLGLIRKVTAGLFLLMALAYGVFLSRNARISTVQRDLSPILMWIIMLGYEQGSRVRVHHYADSLHGDDTKKPELLIQFWLSVNVTRYGVNRFMDADGGGRDCDDGVSGRILDSRCPYYSAAR